MTALNLESLLRTQLKSMVGSINSGEGGSQVSNGKSWCDHPETRGISKTKGGWSNRT